MLAVVVDRLLLLIAFEIGKKSETSAILDIHGWLHHNRGHAIVFFSTRSDYYEPVTWYFIVSL